MTLEQNYKREGREYIVVMATEKQKRVALLLSSIWAAAAVAVYFYMPDADWVTILASLLLMTIGLVAIFGWLRPFFPYIVLSKKDMACTM